jgi:hypothetical protein
MRTIISVIFIHFSLVMVGQDLHKKLTRVNTLAGAQEFIDSNPGLGASMFGLTEGDTTSIGKRLLKKRPGAILEVNGDTYKVIEKHDYVSVRECYIYLNGNVLSFPAIDSLRATIIVRYQKGEAFSTLSDEYNSEKYGSYPVPNGGDLGWSQEGVFVKEFEDAVRERKKGELFTIDIPGNGWYYVVLKTYDNRKQLKISVLKIPGKK